MTRSLLPRPASRRCSSATWRHVLTSLGTVCGTGVRHQSLEKTRQSGTWRDPTSSFWNIYFVCVWEISDFLHGTLLWCNQVCPDCEVLRSGMKIIYGSSVLLSANWQPGWDRMSLFPNVKTGYGTHTVCYPMDFGSSFLSGKGAGVWSWPLRSI